MIVSPGDLLDGIPALRCSLECYLKNFREFPIASGKQVGVGYKLV